MILKIEASLNKSGTVKCMSIVSEGTAQKKSYKHGKMTVVGRF